MPYLVDLAHAIMMYHASKVLLEWLFQSSELVWACFVGCGNL